MRFSDGHIHIMRRSGDRARFIAALEEAGVQEGLLISLPPFSYATGSGEELSCCERLENLFFWKDSRILLHPFFWIDPLEKNIVCQVRDAVTAGVKGFKIICDRFYPSDPRAMEVYEVICETGLPVLFHSGILWDNRPGSSVFNRPVGFEQLLGIKQFVFALAHISWPWCDEMIALYGKSRFLRDASSKDAAELFVDVTPGTPEVYRKEVLTRLLTVGYSVGKNIFFGSDQCVDTYAASSVRNLFERDKKIYTALGVEREEIADIMSGNLRRFLGLSPRR
ncbi:MAG: amidohydrolase family protein [Candidatus Ratteibacteria bacterium]